MSLPRGRPSRSYDATRPSSGRSGACPGFASPRPYLGRSQSRTAHKTKRASVKRPTTANTTPTANEPSAKTFPRLRRRRLRRRRRTRNIALRRQRRSLIPTNTPPPSPMSNEQRAVAQSRDTASFWRRLTCPGVMPVFTGEDARSAARSPASHQPGSWGWPRTPATT